MSDAETVGEKPEAEQSAEPETVVETEKAPAEPVRARYKIEFDADKNKLTIACQAGDTPTRTDINALKAAIDNAGYGNFLLVDKEIQAAVSCLLKNEDKSFVVGERKDGTAEITVSDDKMLAHLILTEAHGGKKMDLSDVRLLITEKNIDCTLTDEELENNWAKAFEEPLIISIGTPPVPGVDAVYEYLFESQAAGPAVTEDGSVNLLELQQFIIAKENQPLLKRIPATLGEEGKNVYGEPVKAEPGKDPGFSKAMQGVYINPDDENEVLAEYKGHPVKIPNGVSVDQTISFDNIDVGTGNVRFDGSVHIKGEVADGLEIDVTGDVFVNGNVGRAIIKAGHNITIMGGVLGKPIEDVDSIDYEKVNFTCHIEAGGSIEAKFVNYSKLVAKKQVSVKDYIYHSYVKSDLQVLVGEESGKGILVGGVTQTKLGVVAKIIGNEAYAKTTINIEDNKKLRMAYERWQSKLELKKEESKKLVTILKNIRKIPPAQLGEMVINKARKVMKTLTVNNELIENIKIQLAEAEEKYALVKSASVDIHTKCFSNVVFNIGDKSHKTAREYDGKGRFSAENGPITHITM